MEKDITQQQYDIRDVHGNGQVNDDQPDQQVSSRGIDYDHNADLQTPTIAQGSYHELAFQELDSLSNNKSEHSQFTTMGIHNMEHKNT